MPQALRLRSDDSELDTAPRQEGRSKGSTGGKIDATGGKIKCGEAPSTAPSTSMINAYSKKQRVLPRSASYFTRANHQRLRDLVSVDLVELPPDEATRVS